MSDVTYVEIKQYGNQVIYHFNISTFPETLLDCHFWVSAYAGSKHPDELGRKFCAELSALTNKDFLDKTGKEVTVVYRCCSKDYSYGRKF